MNLKAKLGFALLLGTITLPIAAAVAWFVVEPNFCSVSKRLVTSEGARAYGVTLIRQDKRFWQSIGVSEDKEIDEMFSERCCNVAKGDYFIGDDSRWRVYLGGKSEGRYDFQYEVFFNECGKAARAEKLVLSIGAPQKAKQGSKSPVIAK